MQRVRTVAFFSITWGYRGTIMMKIIMCDDDERDLRQIAELVEDYCAGYPEQVFQVEQTGSAAGLKEQLEQGKRYDIYILDIMMDEQDGITIGRMIRECSPRSAIVYVTSTPEYAMNAFDVYASGYLLKPVNRERFFACMERVISQLQPREEVIYTFKSREGIVSIELGNLIAVENVSRVMHFHMESGEVYESVYIRKPFEKQLERILEDDRFIQPHKSFIVNMEHVERMLAHDFQMSDGSVVPISRNNLANVKRRYLEFLSKSDRR